VFTEPSDATLPVRQRALDLGSADQVQLPRRTRTGVCDNDPLIRPERGARDRSQARWRFAAAERHTRTVAVLRLCWRGRRGLSSIRKPTSHLHRTFVALIQINFRDQCICCRDLAGVPRSFGCVATRRIRGMFYVPYVNSRASTEFCSH